MIPSPWHGLLLALIAYRLWRLIAEDAILQRPRYWLVNLPRKWQEGDPQPKNYRKELALFINCPWCAGMWVSALVYVIWWWLYGEDIGSVADVVTGLGVVFAISAAVGFQRAQLDPPEE